MTLAYIKINGYSYRYYEPNNYIDYKLLVKQIKRVKEKIRAKETGCYKDTDRYSDYPILLQHLELLLKEKTE
jgi:hypothetical protein